MASQDPTPEPTTNRGVTRRALKVGLFAAVFGLIGRASARAQDALTIAPDGATIYAKYINFGKRLGALVTLYDPGYELGIQPATIYARSGENFAWYKGGAYVEKKLDPGTGGMTMMSLTDGALTVSKSVTAAGAKVAGDLTADGAVTAGSVTSGPVNITGHNVLQLGAGLTREHSAGQIAYQVHSKDALDFIGAGTEWTNRKISMWAEGGAALHGPLTVHGSVNIVRDSQKPLAVAGGVEALHIVRGVVDRDGNTKAGAGFTSKRVDQGLYDITFNPAFSALPGASVTQIYRDNGDPFASPAGYPGDTRDNATIVYIGKDKMRVATGNSSGGRDNRHFSFVVMGPP